MIFEIISHFWVFLVTLSRAALGWSAGRQPFIYPWQIQSKRLTFALDLK